MKNAGAVFAVLTDDSAKSVKSGSAIPIQYIAVPASGLFARNISRKRVASVAKKCVMTAFLSVLFVTKNMVWITQSNAIPVASSFVDPVQQLRGF